MTRLLIVKARVCVARRGGDGSDCSVLSCAVDYGDCLHRIVRGGMRLMHEDRQTLMITIVGL